MMVWKMIFLFQGCILRFHVNLPGCKPYKVHDSSILGTWSSIYPDLPCIHIIYTYDLPATTNWKPSSKDLEHTVDGSEIRLTSWYGRYPIISRILYIPGGAGFLPSTVSSRCGESQIFILWMKKENIQNSQIFREITWILGDSCKQRHNNSFFSNGGWLLWHFTGAKQMIP